MAGSLPSPNLALNFKISIQTAPTTLKLRTNTTTIYTSFLNILFLTARDFILDVSFLEMHNYPDTKVTILISGNGSNLQALIDASINIMPHLKIIRVISNKKDAYGLTRARNASIPTAYHNLVAGKYHAPGEKDLQVKQKARDKYDADLADLVLKDEPDMVVCAGWMHILAPSFLDPLQAKNVPIINLHPALPGKYDGAGAIKRAYDDFQNGTLEDGTTGIMIHYVISEVDRGQPIVVRKVQCKTPETLDELETRIHEQEHQLIVEGTGLAIIDLWEARRKTNA